MKTIYYKYIFVLYIKALTYENRAFLTYFFLRMNSIHWFCVVRIVDKI